MEHHSSGGTVGPKFVAFPKGPKNVVHSEDLGTTNGDGPKQVIDLIVFLLTLGGGFVSFLCSGFLNVINYPESPTVCVSWVAV